MKQQHAAGIGKRTNRPAHTRHSPNVVSMLGQRRRRWANIDAKLFLFVCLLGKARHLQHATGIEQWSNSSVSNDYWRHRLTGSKLQKQSNKATAAWAMTTGDTDSSRACYRNRAIRQQQHEQWLLETQTHRQYATETEQWSNSSVSNDYWRHRLVKSMLQEQSNKATAAWAMTTGDTTHQQHATEIEQ